MGPDIYGTNYFIITSKRIEIARRKVKGTAVQKFHVEENLQLSGDE